MISNSLLVTLALLSATAPFATDMYLPVMPTIAQEFSAEPAVVQLTLTGFFVGMGVGQLLIGPLSDSWGRKPLLIFGATVALLASVVAALAPGIGVLIAARVLQGFGGGACAVLSRAIVPDLLSDKAAAKAFSLLMAVGALAPAIAPVLGGILAEPIGWRGIYWVLVGLHALQLLLAMAVVPRTGGNAPGNTRLLARMAGNFYAVLRVPTFWGYNTATALGFASLFCYISASPFVIQQEMGFSPRAFSAIFALNALGLVGASVFNSRMMARREPATMLRLGGLVQLSACAVHLLLLLAHAPVALQLLALFFSVGPTGLILGNATALATGLLRPYSGSVSALLGFSMSLAASVVAPVMGLGEHLALNMALGMVICSLMALLAGWMATAKRR